MRTPLGQPLAFATFVFLAAALWLPAPLALLTGVFAGIIALRSSTQREEKRR